MRPDEHKRRKNETYKKKQTPGKSSDVQGRRANVRSTLGSNSDRYADLDQETGSTGRNLQELLDATTGQVVSPMTTEDGDAVDTLAVDLSSIEKVIGCFSISQVLGLQLEDVALKGGLESQPGPADCFADYVSNDMDTAYILDHLSIVTPGYSCVMYTNTGRRTAHNSGSSGEISSGSKADIADSNVALSQDERTTLGGIAAACSESSGDDLERKQVELEDWLDSVLDD